jgi:hypothetical protein
LSLSVCAPESAREILDAVTLPRDYLTHAAVLIARSDVLCQLRAFDAIRALLSDLAPNPTPLAGLRRETLEAFLALEEQRFEDATRHLEAAVALRNYAADCGTTLTLLDRCRLRAARATRDPSFTTIAADARARLDLLAKRLAHESEREQFWRCAPHVADVVRELESTRQ